MSELGDLYKQAEEMVLQVYETKPGSNGLSQSWKIAALKEDRISNRRSGIVDQFILDVEATVDRLQKAVEEVKQQEEILEKLVGQMPQVAAKHPPIQEPPYIPPDTSMHGVDGDWN